jgi:origin recognition complex subunit 5
MEARNTPCLGYEQLVDEFSALVSLYPPPFIYINDPISPRVTASVVGSTLESLLDAVPGPSAKIRHAKVNAISCFSARLLYDSVLNALSRWNASWDDGCANWNTGNEERWNENFDGFIHGLCALHAQLSHEEADRCDKGKGKEKEKKQSEVGTEVRLVIVIDRAERLKETLPDLVVPLTRLAELVCEHSSSKTTSLIISFPDSTRFDSGIHFRGAMGGYTTFPWCITRPILHRRTSVTQRKFVVNLAACFPC